MGSVVDPKKKKRSGRTRANGEGTIWQNPSGSWTAQVSTPYGRISKTFPGRRQAVIWSNEQRSQLDTGEYIEPSQQALNDWWEVWVHTYKRTSVSEMSMLTYRQSKRRIVKLAPELLAMPLPKIQVSDVQHAINTLCDSGLAPRTCALTLIHLRDCLGRAVKDRLIKFNPAADAEKPKSHLVAPASASPLTDDEGRGRCRRNQV